MEDQQGDLVLEQDEFNDGFITKQCIYFIFLTPVLHYCRLIKALLWWISLCTPLQPHTLGALVHLICIVLAQGHGKLPLIQSPVSLPFSRVTLYSNVLRQRLRAPVEKGSLISKKGPVLSEVARLFLTLPTLKMVIKILKDGYVLMQNQHGLTHCCLPRYTQALHHLWS